MKLVDGLYVLPTDELARQQGCYVDLEEPEKIRAFVSKFCTLQTNDYSGKAGRKLKLLPYQEAIINTVWGWRKPDGTLRFKEAYLFCSRRQGKSVLASILTAYHACKARRAVVPIVASTKEEARAIYDRVVDFVDGSEALQARMKPVRSHLTVEDKLNKSLIKVLSGDRTGKLGKGIDFLSLDEIAFWPQFSARDIWAKLLPSLKDKINALVFSISTPGFDLAHLWHEKYKHCQNILKNESDDTSTFPAIFAAPDNWREDVAAGLEAACPALDVTVSKADLLDEWSKAEGNPIKEAEFETWYCARPVGSPEIWIPQNFWLNCQKGFHESELYGHTAVTGLDYGASFDLTAITHVIEKDDCYYLLPRFFIPREIAKEKEQRDGVPYIRWAQTANANLTLTEGDVVDSAALIERLKHDATLFNIKQIRFDRTRLEGFRQLIEREGFEMVEVAQTVNAMSPAFSLMERLIREGKIRHNDNPLSNWCMSNAKPDRKHDRLMVRKSGDANKIDFIDSTAIALTSWIEGEQPDPTKLPDGQQWATQW